MQTTFIYRFMSFENAGSYPHVAEISAPTLEQAYDKLVEHFVEREVIEMHQIILDCKKESHDGRDILDVPVVILNFNGELDVEALQTL